VLADLRWHYRTGRIAYSLRTRSVRAARVRAMSYAAKLDRHWHIMRMFLDDCSGKHLLENADVSEARSHDKKGVTCPLLGGYDEPETLSYQITLFGPISADVKHYLIHCCGMKQLNDFVRSDATEFRDYLFEKGLNGASVARIFGTVRAFINLALSGFWIAIVNPFSNVYFDRSVRVKKRLPCKA
jgi:hypothetical protein